jgi:ABC-type polysaccharide/polyol phosphate export permease
MFSSGIDLVPSLAIGLTLWTFMSSCILEGCNSFVSADEIVKQLPIPLFVHVERVVVRNLLIFAHNAVIVPLVLVFFGNAWSWLALLSLAGLCLIVVNLL